MGRIRAAAAAGAVLALGSIASDAFGGSVRAESAAAWASSPQTVVVGYTTRHALAGALRGSGAQIIRTVPELRTAELRTRAAASVAARLAARPGIRYAEPAAPRAPQVEPAVVAGPQATYEWQYAAAREDSVPAWVLRAASAVTIATVDTGADVTAPDLAAKNPATWDVLTQSHDVRDDNGHGTFVASLAAGSVTNGDGMAGFGGDVRLLVVRAGRPDGSFTDVDEAAAIVYAVDHGANIVNLSLGGPSTSTTERAAIAYAAQKGVLLVAAAGNERLAGNPVEYPAALLQPVGSNGLGGTGLSVGASTAGGTRAAFSNTGSYLSLAAPGVNVLGAVSTTSSPALFPRVALPDAHGGLYGLASGTSFAAPEVAGAAALVWAANPALGAADVAEILKETAGGAGAWSPDLGYGVVDAAAAVAKAEGTATVRVTAATVQNRVHLTWIGDGTTYRVSASKDGGPEATVVAATSADDAWVDVEPGHAYTFTVGAFDATGTAVAVSAPASVRIARETATLSLGAISSGTGRVRVTARLQPSVGGVPVTARRLELAVRGHGEWRPNGTASTDAEGSATWSLSLAPGTYMVRASFAGGADIASARSRVVTFVVR
jgi:subtilisin family serine protease